MRVALFILLCVANDTGGYVVGVLIGRHPLAPSVSPKKTWEGLLGSVVLASVVGVLGIHFMFDGDPALGALLGFCLAYGIERKYIRFETKAVWWAQILKVVLGLAVVLAVKEGLKLVFSALGFTWLGTNAIRYFAVVLMAATVWPLTFRFFARLGKKKQ